MNPLLQDSKKRWTYEKYSQLEEETHGEIIEGVYRMTPAPSSEHQYTVMHLGNAFLAYIKKNNLGTVFVSPIDVILSEDTIVQPDIVFVSKQNSSSIRRRGIVGIPDLVVEILSRSSIKYDCYEKKALYKKFGVREYWMVDPYRKSIEVLNLIPEGYEIFSFAIEHGLVKSNVLVEFTLEILEILAPEYPE